MTRIQHPLSDTFTCRTCRRDFPTVKARNKHIKDLHDQTIQEYLIKEYLDNISPICECGCNTPVSIVAYSTYFEYSRYTKNHFPRKPVSEETKKKVKENTRKAIQAKYGVDHIFQLKEFQDKAKAGVWAKYGVGNVMQDPTVKESNRHIQSEETREKIRQTNQERYGAKSYPASKEGKLAIKEANMKNLGVSNPAQTPQYIQNRKQYSLQKYGVVSILGLPEYRLLHNSKTSPIEDKIREALGGEKFYYENREYDIKVGNTVIEVDGDFWHPSNLENLTILQIGSAVNDYKKNIAIENSEYDFYRIYVSNLPETITLENIKAHSHPLDFHLTYSTPILAKQYLLNYATKKGVNKLEKQIPLLLKFIRTFQPEFPEIETTENINQVQKYIRDFDLTRLYQEGVGFNNKQYITGVPLLKHLFSSYWDSSYRGSISPKQAWGRDDIMHKIIKYRIGLNPAGECFDFSIKNLITGLTVNRYPVSFFKPMLAAAIYRKYLGEAETPTVFDPCAGFGGRLLGFKSTYPNGTYIGIEPNKKTFEELQQLVILGNLTNVKLHNCKIEDFTEAIEYDFAFTSIPYFDLEDYNNPDITYTSFNHWKNTFISTLLKYDNLHININAKLFEDLSEDFIEVDKIWSTISPFNPGKEKYEPILIKR